MTECNTNWGLGLCMSKFSGTIGIDDHTKLHTVLYSVFWLRYPVTADNFPCSSKPVFPMESSGGGNKNGNIETEISYYILCACNQLAFYF